MQHDLASAIDSDDIRGADGRTYFELKLRALTFAGDYRTAATVVEQHLDLFDTDPDIHIAYGVVLYVPALQNGAPEVVDLYRGESESRLIEMAPIGFIATIPFHEPASDAETRWWE